MSSKQIAQRSLWGALVAGIAASACCVGPLLLLMLGMGGTWVSTLMRFEPLRPYAVGVTLLLLSIAFWQLYITPRRCRVYKPCIQPNHLRWQRGVFWVVSLLLIGLLTFPWYAAWFY